MRHARLHEYENYGGRIQPAISFATAGTWPSPGWHGRNHLPQHRLFVVFACPKASKNYLVHHRDGLSDRQLALEAGHAYFMPRQADLSFQFAGGLELFSAHFVTESAPGIDLHSEQSLCCGQMLPRELVKHMRMSCRAYRSQPNDSRSMLTLHAAMLRCLVSLVDVHFSPIDEVLRNQVRWSGFFDYVNKHLTAELRIKQLAKTFSEQPDTLARRFKREFGMSLKKWLIQRLLQRALDMLLTQTAPVRAIADELCFSSEFQFSRFIKRETGQSPSEFRTFSRL